MDPRARLDHGARAGDARDRRDDAKRHKDVSCNLEYYGAERVWVSTTGLATGDCPWPALTVPEPRQYFLPAGFHAPAFADTHVTVMLLGVGDTRRHSEYQWFRYARASQVTRFSVEMFERWLPQFCARLVCAGARSGDPLVAADGMDAAFRMVDKFPNRKDTCARVDARLAASARALRLSFLDAARAAARAAAARELGADFLESLKRSELELGSSSSSAGEGTFLARRNVRLDQCEYDFSSARALYGEEAALADEATPRALGESGLTLENPARLLVAAACAYAEQAERSNETQAVARASPARAGGRGVGVLGRPPAVRKRSLRVARAQPRQPARAGAGAREPARRRRGGARGGAARVARDRVNES